MLLNRIQKNIKDIKVIQMLSACVLLTGYL